MSRDLVPFGEAFRLWLKVGLLGFGGPAGQIALMHRLVVEEKRWIGEARFLQALNYCMLLPGPEAQQLATYIGWLTNRTWGGIVAGTLFVLPGLLVLLGLSSLYLAYRDLGWMQGLFVGVKAAVLALVVEALLRVAKRALHSRLAWGIAGLAFIALFAFAVPFPFVILAAALLGLALHRLAPGALAGRAKQSTAADSASPLIPDDARLPHTAPSWRRAGLVLMVCLGLWVVPVAACWIWLGPQHVLTQQALFFSKMAIVTFGGAYAVLSYVGQEAVSTYGWLAPGEMLDGLGLAETTPGPLILVLTFVGYLGAYHAPLPFTPTTAGLLGGLLTTWVTFVPCFLWIFLGAPWIEKLRTNPWLSAALSAITAAVWAFSRSPMKRDFSPFSVSASLSAVRTA